MPSPSPSADAPTTSETATRKLSRNPPQQIEQQRHPHHLQAPFPHLPPEKNAKSSKIVNDEKVNCGKSELWKSEL